MRGERRRESFHVNVPFYKCARAETQYMCRGGDRHTRHVRKNNVRCADTQYICKSYKIEIHHNIRDIYIYLSIDRSIYLYIYSSICLFIYLSTNTNIHRSIEYRAHSHFDARNVSKMHVRTRLRMCVCLCVCTIHHLPPTLSPFALFVLHFFLCAPYTISLQPCPLL